MSNLQGGLCPKQSHRGEQLCGDSLGRGKQHKLCKYQGSGLPTAAAAGTTTQVSQVLPSLLFNNPSGSPGVTYLEWMQSVGLGGKERKRIKNAFKAQTKSAETQDELKSCWQGREA